MVKEMRGSHDNHILTEDCRTHSISIRKLFLEQREASSNAIGNKMSSPSYFINYIVVTPEKLFWKKNCPYTSSTTRIRGLKLLKKKRFFPSCVFSHPLFPLLHLQKTHEPKALISNYNVINKLEKRE